jgi:hypothetical protein
MLKNPNDKVIAQKDLNVGTVLSYGADKLHRAIEKHTSNDRVVDEWFGAALQYMSNFYQAELTDNDWDDIEELRFKKRKYVLERYLQRHYHGQRRKSLCKINSIGRSSLHRLKFCVI